MKTLPARINDLKIKMTFTYGNQGGYKMKFAAGKVLKLSRDEYADNPREWDNIGKMVCFHNRYNLGDKHSFSTVRDFIESLAMELGMTWEQSHNTTDEALWKYINKKAVILPLYLYDHSGITMSTGSFNDPWDSGQVGWIYATHEAIKQNYMVKRLSKKLVNRAISLLEGEVKEYALYLEGNVWCFECIDEEGNTVDSCCGFYGDIKESGLLEAIPDEYRGLDPVYA